MDDFPEKLLSLRKRLRITQDEMARRLGVSSNYVSMLEGGRKEPSENLRRVFAMIESEGERGLIQEPDAESRLNRRIPVLGWAHAGHAASYDELPQDWQEQIPTDCRDPKAFALRLEGDSMEPKFSEGELLIVQPTEPPHGGCLVVARFADDGVIFRRFETTGKIIRLVPINERYPVTEHSADEFSWIYPLWGRWTQLWK